MKTIKTDLICSLEGIDLCSVNYELTDKILENIQKAKNVLISNSILKSVVIEGDSLKVIQFDSTIDDEERKKLDYQDFGYFRTDVHDIIVYRGGGAYFRAYGKYNGNEFYEFEIEY